MNQKASLFRLRNSVAASSPPCHVSLVQQRHKSCGGGKNREKMKVYHKVPELDRVMDLRKKPALILELKSIIQSQKSKSLLLRDLEKEVGFIRKWNFMAVIQKYSMIFQVCGGAAEKTPPFVKLTGKSEKLAGEEPEALESMERIAVKNLRKLLMLTVDSQAPIEKIKLIRTELGLSDGFERSLIPKFPEYFSVKDSLNGKPNLHLENWDSSLAVTVRERNLAAEGINSSDGNPNGVRISRDGNYPGPHAFKVKFPLGFRPNTDFLNEYLFRWQKKDFPSPYLNARRFDNDDPGTRKRAVGLVHEILSLTIEKRLTTAQIRLFGPECYLPSELILFLVRHHGIFYLTNKGERSTVFLKEAYDGSELIEKCPILSFNDKFVALSGRVGDSSSPKMCVENFERVRRN